MRISLPILAAGIAAMLLAPMPTLGQNHWFGAGTTDAEATQPCSLTIPTLVYISITDTIKFAIPLGGLTDSIWPKYFYPTRPGSAPYCRVNYWTNSGNGARVLAKGSGDWSGQDSLEQLYRAPTGTPKTSNGGVPAPPWTAFTVQNLPVCSTSVRGIGRGDQDYQYRWNPDDDPVKAAITLTYRVEAR
ncbi:hypothetical protein FJY70_03630 [candidate division WOR-3 bacterium]|nr:hypothetical protein [candidate division WOR-3 bacterium]